MAKKKDITSHTQSRNCIIGRDFFSWRGSFLTREEERALEQQQHHGCQNYNVLRRPPFLSLVLLRSDQSMLLFVGEPQSNCCTCIANMNQGISILGHVWLSWISSVVWHSGANFTHHTPPLILMSVWHVDEIGKIYSHFHATMYLILIETPKAYKRYHTRIASIRGKISSLFSNRGGKVLLISRLSS